jgi:7-cyano-7-deazaguanine synthase
VFIGANAIDYSGYPDCRPEFISAFERMANLATKMTTEQKDEGGRLKDETGKQALSSLRFTIHTPLIHLTKAQIIQRGASLGVDYGMTHSCYDPDTQGRACGHCDSCLLRKKGFAAAGVADPTLYS